jgi:hypothetical protein
MDDNCPEGFREGLLDKCIFGSERYWRHGKTAVSLCLIYVLFGGNVRELFGIAA